MSITEYLIADRDVWRARAESAEGITDQLRYELEFRQEKEKEMQLAISEAEAEVLRLRKEMDELLASKTIVTHDQDDDPVDVEEYIRSLPMDSMTERERTLVAGNIRGFAVAVREAMIEQGPGALAPCPECGRSCTCP